MFLKLTEIVRVPDEDGVVRGTAGKESVVAIDTIQSVLDVTPTEIWFRNGESAKYAEPAPDIIALLDRMGMVLSV